MAAWKLFLKQPPLQHRHPLTPTPVRPRCHRSMLVPSYPRREDVPSSDWPWLERWGPPPRSDGLTPCVQSAGDPGLHLTQALLRQPHLFHCVSSFPAFSLTAFPNKTTYLSGFFFLVGFQMKFLPQIFLFIYLIFCPKFSKRHMLEGEKKKATAKRKACS